MKFFNIKTLAFLPPLFPLLLPLLFCSCKGQSSVKNSAGENKKETTSMGRIVDAVAPKIYNIYQAKNGDFWFGSGSDQGVFKYSPDSTGTKVLTQFTMADGLSGNRIRSIKEDKLGNIYLDALAGVNKYNGQTFERLDVSYELDVEWKLSADDLWFEGEFSKDGVYRYNGQQLELIKLPRHELVEEFFEVNGSPNFINPHEIYHTHKDRQGNIWMGAAIFGTFRFDGKNGRWISEREMTEIDPGPSAGVRSILEDRDGYFWFSSNVNYKYKILPDSTGQGKYLNYEKLPGIDTSVDEDLSVYFMALTEDNDGDIWLASYTSGVRRYDGEKLIHYPVRIDNVDIELFTIYKDNDGGIWLGSHNAGPLKFNGTEFVKFIP